jgi:hypothetical protein
MRQKRKTCGLVFGKREGERESTCRTVGIDGKNNIKMDGMA